MSTTLKQFESLKKEHDDLIRVSQGYKTHIDTLDGRQVELFENLQRQIEKAEEASLERDKLLLREKHNHEEIQRLQDCIKDMTTKHKDKLTLSTNE